MKWGDKIYPVNEKPHSRLLHSGIKCTPYEAMFDTKAKIGLKKYTSANKYNK